MPAETSSSVKPSASESASRGSVPMETSFPSSSPSSSLSASRGSVSISISTSSVTSSPSESSLRGSVPGTLPLQGIVVGIAVERIGA